MGKSINELYYEYKEDKNNYDVSSQLYQQALKLGFREYWDGGFYRRIEEEEAKSVIGMALSKSLVKFIPDDDKGSYSTYLTRAIRNNFCMYIRDNYKDTAHGIVKIHLSDLYKKNDNGEDHEDSVIELSTEMNEEEIGREEELKNEIVISAIPGYDPNNIRHKKKYDRFMKVLNYSLMGLNDIEISEMLGYKNRCAIANIYKEIRIGAKKLEEFKDAKQYIRPKNVRKGIRVKNK